MEEDASHAERTSIASSTSATQPPQQPPENTELLIPSFTPTPVPAPAPTATGTLSRLGLKFPSNVGLKSPTSPTAAAPGSPVDRGQVSAITVVALLDKLVNMLDVVQENQQRMEQRQAELEGAVRVLQGDVTRLSKTHIGTSNNVSKLLERSRKVNGNIKEVKERMDKQAVQVKRLEANHNHLLKRNNFKVLIFQDDNEIPSSVLVKDSLKTPQPSQFDAESTHCTPSIMESVDGSRYQEEGLQTVSLSSEEALDLPPHREEEESLVGDASVSLDSGPCMESRATLIKRNSLKKMNSLKKAFTRQSFEKKMTQISTKIVPQERREKILKSLTPNHPKSPTAKASSFKVAPMTFNVKKVRDGETPTRDIGLPEEPVPAHVEIPLLEGLDGELPLAKVHSEEVFVEEVKETVSPTIPESIKAEVAINGEAAGIAVEVNGDRTAGLAVPEHDEDVAEDDDEEEEE
ncbi:hypothetical protein LDENG_00014840, partial [Lucifuga dentata]